MGYVIIIIVMFLVSMIALHLACRKIGQLVFITDETVNFTDRRVWDIKERVNHIPLFWPAYEYYFNVEEHVFIAESICFRKDKLMDCIRRDINKKYLKTALKAITEENSELKSFSIK